MNDSWDSADIDQAKADLLAAGWIEKTHTAWKAPDGSLHRGPAEAWRTMKREQNNYLHTCHSMNPPFPYDCAACKKERHADNNRQAG